MADYRFSDDHNTLYVKGSAIGNIVVLGSLPSYDANSSLRKLEDYKRAMMELLAI